MPCILSIIIRHHRGAICTIETDTSVSHCKYTAETEQFPRTTVRFLFVFALPISHCKDTATEKGTFRFYADFEGFCRLLPNLIAFFPFPVQRYGSRKQHLQFSVVSFSFLRDFSWYFSFLQFPSGFFRLHAPNTLQRYGNRKGYFPFNCGLRLLLRIIAD